MKHRASLNSRMIAVLWSIEDERKVQFKTVFNTRHAFLFHAGLFSLTQLRCYMSLFLPTLMCFYIDVRFDVGTSSMNTLIVQSGTELILSCSTYHLHLCVANV